MKRHARVIPENSMDECVAMTQAMIGYPLQQHIYNELQTRKSDLQVATIVTQVLVDRDKLESLKPTKPIGPFYTKEQARQIAEETGMVMAEDSRAGLPPAGCISKAGRDRGDRYDPQTVRCRCDRDQRWRRRHPGCAGS